MAIQKGYQSNLETIIKAAKNGDLALVECTDKVTGNTVIAVCAISYVDGEYIISPLAKMFDGNPYEELNPPE
jgi:hypothetical protein